MGIFSKNQEFSVAQVITAGAISTNVIDLGQPGTPAYAQGPIVRDIGKGTPIPILIQVVQDFATLTSLTIHIETSDNADLSSSDIALTIGTIPLANLVAGYKVALQFLPNNINRRYLGLRYSIGGSNPTAGAITAGITMGNQTND